MPPLRPCRAGVPRPPAWGGVARVSYFCLALRFVNLLKQLLRRRNFGVPFQSLFHHSPRFSLAVAELAREYLQHFHLDIIGGRRRFFRDRLLEQRILAH